MKRMLTAADIVEMVSNGIIHGSDSVVVDLDSTNAAIEIRLDESQILPELPPVGTHQLVCVNGVLHWS